MKWVRKRYPWYWTAEEEAEVLRSYPNPNCEVMVPGRSRHAIKLHAHKMGLTRHMVDPNEVFSDRRARELEQRLADEAERERKAAEEAARRERAPTPCGNGRVFRP